MVSLCLLFCTCLKNNPHNTVNDAPGLRRRYIEAADGHTLADRWGMTGPESPIVRRESDRSWEIGNEIPPTTSDISREIVEVAVPRVLFPDDNDETMVRNPIPMS